MASPIPKKFYTEEEYLEFERASEEKHEWLNGRIYPLGEPPPSNLKPSVIALTHSAIVANVTAEIVLQSRGKNSRAFSKDIKVRAINATTKADSPDSYSYPDLTVVCGEPKFHVKFDDVLINPQVIVEVLSPATEGFDRGKKFHRFQFNSSLTDYILIAQDEPRIEHYVRQSEDRWLLTVTTGLESEAHIASIECTLRLSDV
jgi:Uma2 family endonuclease